MQKDVVYIDVEDDITAIIGKVKASKEKIVALVPPKRIGVLQSAVNLRLLARAAHGSHKHLVLITNNQALTALSAAAKIPIAKNLQSKPELAEIPALSVDDDDDIIDGENLSVDEKSTSVPDSALAGVDVDETPKATPPSVGSKPAKPRVKSGIKVPDFDVFRKKVFILAGAGVLFVVFLVWAIFFAGNATVVIDARTTPTDVKTAVAISPTLATNAETGSLKSVQMQDKSTQTVEFDATGTQDVGDKATGTMTLTRSVPGSVTVPFGTGFSSGTCTFVSQAQVVVPGATPVWNGSGFSVSPGTIDVQVQAAAIGDDCNLPPGSYTPAVDGVSAAGKQMSGGTKRQIKVVTQDDVEKAKTQLVAQNSDDAKKKLQAEFDKNTILINDSFQSTPAAPQSVPDVGQELKDPKAKLTSEVTYSMSGVTQGDLSQYLQAALQKQLNSDQQRVYSDGSKNAQLSGFKQNNGNTSVSITATGQIGPKINDDDIKNTVKGKNFGEVQILLKKIDGVNDAQTKFWPFWVNTIPNDTKKIKIEFKLQND